MASDWLAGGLAGGGWGFAGAGWEAGWPQGPPGAEDTGFGEGKRLSRGPETVLFHIETHQHYNTGQGILDIRHPDQTSQPGGPQGAGGYTMDIHGIYGIWRSLYIPWISMVYIEISIYTMGIHGIYRDLYIYHGYPWYI